MFCGVAAGLGVDVADLHRVGLGPVGGQRLERSPGVGPGVAQHRVGLRALRRALKHGRRHDAAAGVGTLAAPRCHRLAGAVDVVAGFHVVHQWQVEHVEPDHRLVAVVAVLMP